MRRCSDEVLAYESRIPARPVPARPRAQEPPEAPPLVPPPRQQNDYESDDVPSIARFARGRWEYGRLIATPRGRVLRWFQPSAFTSGELESSHFQQLRDVAQAAMPQDVAAAFNWVTIGG